MSTETQIKSMLDELANYKAQVDALRFQEQAAIDSILTPELLAEVDAIKSEFSGKSEGAQANIAELEKEIKLMVLSHGATVKAEFFMAVRNKGRVTWDSSKLSGYAAAHPEIEQFKKVGNPTVTIRTV